MPVRAGQLLEREAELDELTRALEQARSGSGWLVTVEGTAGIGKTRLLSAARDTARQLGMEVLTARGTELERDFPFALLRQLFEPVLRAADPTRREELLAGAARLAGPVVGLEDATERESLVDPSFPTLNALYWLTSNLAEARPMMLAVDDIHWADRPSLRFIRFLLPRLEDLPVLLAVAARPSEPNAASELLAQLASDPAVRVLRPAPLSTSAVTELVRGELYEGADDTFCASCHEVTGGNPFMLRELLVELNARGVRGSPADASHVREVVPVTIQRAVLGRLAGLSAEAQQLATALAVLGDEAPPRLVAELAGIDRGAATEAADALTAVEILEAGRPLRFVHPLVRNAIYIDLPGAAKSGAHRQASELLAHDHAEPERIALHLLATDPAADQQVVDTLLAAARRALQRGAPETAASYLRRALAEPAESAVRPHLLRLLVRAYFRAGDQSGFQELLESGALEELIADPQRLLASAEELSLVLYNWGRSDEMAALLERATETAIAAADDDLAARFQAFLAFWGQLPPAEALARLERFQHRISPDSPSERLHLTLRSFWGLLTGERPAPMAEIARRAVQGGRIWREFPDTPLPTFAIWVLRLADELSAAESANAERLAVLGRSNGAYSTGIDAWIRTELALLRGEVALAEAEARTAVEAARQGGFLAGFPTLLANLVEALLERDAPVFAEAELAAMGLDKGMPESWIYSPVLLARARLRLAQTAPSRALDDLLALRRISDEAGISAPYYSAGAYLALALHGVEDRSQAQAVAEQEVADARAYGLPRRLGIALRVLGLLENGEQRLQLLRESVGVLESSPARLEAARSLAEYGAALRRANRRADAREPLRAALDTARRSGALAVARRAHEELAATGEKLRPLLAGGVESLTPSERRVAEMAAEGMHNREIAQTLFLTLKTIETHLSNAYRKLDVHSRTELPDALHTER